ncbi:MAG: LysR family transcriptional regulator [Treponema sp.]|nr:LysR family transcriptional regulator [Treponema sp.]
MELRILRYFLAVAKEENFTKAAMSLNVSQPALSRQIAQLEDELGQTLFVRSSHCIVLTDAGLLLKRRAEEMLSLEDKIRREFSNDGDEISGELAFGCDENMGMLELAEKLAECWSLPKNLRNSKGRIRKSLSEFTARLPTT